mgnify:CR=1 FL=1
MKEVIIGYIKGRIILNKARVNIAKMVGNEEEAVAWTHSLIACKDILKYLEDCT